MKGILDGRPIQLCFRKFLLAVTVLFASAGVALAEDWPARPVHVVVPFPPGGPAEILARLFAQAAADKWKQPVVVETRAGATGSIGTEAVEFSPGLLWLQFCLTFCLSIEIESVCRGDP